MLGLEERRADELAQLAVGELRGAAVTEGVLVPEVAFLVAGPTDLPGVREGHVLAGRVDHQVHLRPDPLADRVDVGDLLGDRRADPSRGS